MKRSNISSFHLRILTIVVGFATSNAVRSDIDCLRSIKETVEDNKNLLSSWDFTNNTEGFICQFIGVECWHPDESKVLNLKLANMGLRGPFPLGLKNCTSLTGLDLSYNQLTGPIPSNLGDVLSFITSLDLSFNNLSGSIPSSIVTCSVINVLRLNDNRLTGVIPSDMSELKRIREFNVANNKLSGPVPIFSGINISSESYANNSELCGGPLTSCKDGEHDAIKFSDPLFFSGFTAGCSLFTFLSILFMFLCWPRLSISSTRYHTIFIRIVNGQKHHLPPGRQQIQLADDLLPGRHQIQLAEEISSEERKVIDMIRFNRRLSLVDLKMATNNFDDKKVIGYGNMGVMYKGVFPNGLPIAVKRIHKFESYEKEFLSEIEILGRLHHTNIVLSLGYCFEMGKKFLVYEYMCNGTLHQWLHCTEAKKMGWTLRFKIAIGIARGLTWLHHNNVLRVAHLKISSKSILLDDTFEPKISNFGISNILMNTNGIPSSGCNFVVPDSSPNPYKEDVYCFGILLLELVTGKEPSTAINSSTSYEYEFDAIDGCLMGQGFNEEISKTLGIAEKCIQARKDGETSMLQVYQAIRAIQISENEISVDSCMDVEDGEGNV